MRIGVAYNYVCLLCHYHTHDCSAMRVHIRRHIGDKPFKCNMCHYSASLKTDLKTHMRIKHDQSLFNVFLELLKKKNLKYVGTSRKWSQAFLFTPVFVEKKKTQFSIVGNQKMCLNCMFITFFLIFKFTYTANFRIQLIAQKVENVSVYN